MNNTQYAYKFFPNITEELKSKLLIDDVGMYSISTPRKADIISRIISDSFHKYLSPNAITITDAMAGVGGNVISFSRHFYNVNAIEMNDIRYKYMVSNYKLYSCNNIIPIQHDYLKICTDIKQDVIFIDPPWGGKNYKDYDSIDIKIGDLSIENLCKYILNKQICRLLVLKLPKNFNTSIFKQFKKIKLYDLKKMILVLIYSTIQ